MIPAEVLIVAAVVALVGGGIYFGWRLERKRTEAMQQAALMMGFRYEQQAADPGARFGALPLLERGHSRRAKNVMDGELAGEPATVFDYRYVTGSGKNQTTHNQTVALFPTRGRGLPDFELGPENVFHKLGQVFGYQDIDFEQFPEFSKRFLLRGEDEAAIRRAFTAHAISALEQATGWSVQSRGDALCAFRVRKRCKPEETPSFLADALRIASALTREG